MYLTGNICSLRGFIRLFMCTLRRVSIGALAAHRLTNTSKASLHPTVHSLLSAGHQFPDTLCRSSLPVQRLPSAISVRTHWSCFSNCSLCCALQIYHFPKIIGSPAYTSMHSDSGRADNIMTQDPRVQALILRLSWPILWLWDLHAMSTSL